MKIFLEQCTSGRMPLSYGSSACSLVLGDSRFTEQIVALRNNSEVNRFIHHDHLTPEAHERWLSAQMQRGDSLDFVVLVHGAFAGTASLYNIVPGQRCEYGRLVMCPDERRMYVIAVEFLCLSLAFEVLRVRELYCTVVKENASVLNFHLRNGWKLDERFDQMVRVNGSEVLSTGLSISAADWPSARESVAPILKRLHGRKSDARHF